MIQLKKRIAFLVGLTVSLAILNAFAQNGPPAYLAESWVNTGGPLGGLGYDIRYNFTDHDIWYVTDAWSGVFISTDRGLTWTSSNEGITARKGRDAIPVFCATVDPHDHSSIWIGTEGTGDIFKSTDGGHSWTLKRNGIDPDQQVLSFRGFTVDPRTSDIIYAMAEIGSSGWTADREPIKGIEMDLTMGVVFKTTDGGENWTEIWRGNNLARYCWINPRDPEMIYVSTGIFDRESAITDTAAGFAGGVGILKSTDGGENWQVQDQANGLLDLYIGSLYMHPRNPDTLLAAAGQNNWSGYYQEHTGGIYITTNGGDNWTRVIGSQEMFLVVEYSTNDPDIAYAFSPEAVYRSYDAGFTWQRFSRTENMWGPPGIVAGLPIDAQCDPEDPMRIIVNNYLGGNLLSTDGGVTWIKASKGYTGALMSHLSVVPGAPQIVYAGSRSGIYRSENGGKDWIGLCNPPEGMFAKFNEIIALAVDPLNPNHVLTMPSDFGTVVFSYDCGAVWHIGTMTGGISSLVFAPSDPSIVYAAAQTGFNISTDGGEHFNLIHADEDSKSITALVVHPADADILYASTQNAGFRKSVDGGNTWNNMGTGLPSLSVKSLVIHTLNPDLMFAGIAEESELGGQGVYRSIDGGETWTQQGAGMEPNARVMSVVVDPNDVDIAYACDHLSGVYVSTNGGDHWLDINKDLNHRTMNVLSLSDDGTALYAGTMGAGVYRLGDVPETAVSDEQLGMPTEFILKQNYPNPFNAETIISFGLTRAADVKINVYNHLGQKVTTLLNMYKEAGWYKVSLSAARLTSGIYYYQLQINNIITETKKMVLLR